MFIYWSNKKKKEKQETTGVLRWRMSAKYEWVSEYDFTCRSHVTTPTTVISNNKEKKQSWLLSRILKPHSHTHKDSLFGEIDKNIFFCLCQSDRGETAIKKIMKNQVFYQSMIKKNTRIVESCWHIRSCK